MNPDTQTKWRGACYCGLIPLVLGVGIFLFWVLSPSLGLEGLGFLNIGLGLMTCGVGFLLLLCFMYESLKAGRSVRVTLAWSLVPTILILSNFPACYAILQSVEKIKQGERLLEQAERTSLHIFNASDKELTDLRLTEVIVPKERSRIGPHQLTTFQISPEHKGELKIQLAWDNSVREMTIWSTRPVRNGQWLIVMMPNGSLSITALESDGFAD